MLEEIKKTFPEPPGPPQQYGALALAYLGDCVYEMYVRTYLLRLGDQKVKALHKKATKLVCAKAQADFYQNIAEMLTPEESAVFHRGRNTKSQIPKNASVAEYRTATGVESLLGYLFLQGNTERISQLMRRLFETA